VTILQTISAEDSYYGQVLSEISALFINSLS
jgi:hypothetical protein